MQYVKIKCHIALSAVVVASADLECALKTGWTMKFNNNDDVKYFAKLLKEKLIEVNEITLANELNDWEDTFYTTSSEFLGELKFILERVKNLKTFDVDTQSDIGNCIISLNKALA